MAPSLCTRQQTLHTWHRQTSLAAFDTSEGTYGVFTSSLSSSSAIERTKDILGTNHT
ncbi:hypothetical protein BofuT4_P086640.1 [Botrytis cinerea T4]|nr:hypothetical protein BofuT4_P086640.1 [Botrytis cinerea T4]